jgi:tripeptide aminopeptidase
MDTSEAASDENIKTAIVEYNGGDILLNTEKNIYMKTSDYPCLDSYVGDRLIVTDGTTLLGADDKAGIAEILTMLESLIASGEEHGTIKIGITPDEEVGRGADHFDVEKFAADYAYTVDGGALGELEYENFNAAGATVTIHGVSIHPGSAKNKMKNAVTIAMEYNALLPALEVPEKTEGYEGFHNLYKMTAETELATMSYILRDHDKAKIEAMKAQFLKAAEEINARFGEGTAEVSLRDSYSNMREIIEQHMYIIDRAKKAMADVGIAPNIVPIRGGTDGARLSFRGLPCPNLCTGGENFHSRFEFVSIESMEKITDLLLQIVRNSVSEGIAE